MAFRETPRKRISKWLPKNEIAWLHDEKKRLMEDREAKTKIVKREKQGRIEFSLQYLKGYEVICTTSS